MNNLKESEIESEYGILDWEASMIKRFCKESPSLSNNQIMFLVNTRKMYRFWGVSSERITLILRDELRKKASLCLSSDEQNQLETLLKNGVSLRRTWADNEKIDNEQVEFLNLTMKIEAIQEKRARLLIEQMMLNDNVSTPKEEAIA